MIIVITPTTSCIQVLPRPPYQLVSASVATTAPTEVMRMTMYWVMRSWTFGS
jgi:hypothetical protein